jgi:hypothetical protein
MSRTLGSIFLQAHAHDFCGFFRADAFVFKPFAGPALFLSCRQQRNCRTCSILHRYLEYNRSKLLAQRLFLFFAYLLASKGFLTALLQAWH